MDEEHSRVHEADEARAERGSAQFEDAPLESTSSESAATDGEWQRAAETAREMSPAELAEAREYGRLSLYVDLADRAVDFVYLAVMAFVLARPLDAWLQSYALLSERAWLRLIPLFFSVYGIHLAVSLPLSYYSGYVLEHRFGLSNLTRLGWLRRFASRHLFGVVLGCLMYLGLFALIWTAGGAWWLIAAGCYFLLAGAGRLLFPLIFRLLFYKTEQVDDPELQARLGRLAEGTSLRVEGIGRMLMSAETKKANAMLGGAGRSKRVLLSDTLLESYSPEEIEVIFAHELGHHVQGHLSKLTVGIAFLSLGAFWLCDFCLRAYAPGAEYRAMPIHALPLLMFATVVFMSASEPLLNFVSRRYERQADRYALRKTGRVDAFISAFRKLAIQNKDDPDPHPLEVRLFMDHPPIAQRIAFAEAWRAEGGDGSRKSE